MPGTDEHGEVDRLLASLEDETFQGSAVARSRDEQMAAVVHRKAGIEKMTRSSVSKTQVNLRTEIVPSQLQARARPD